MSFSLQDVKREDVNYFRGQTSLPYLAIQDNFTSEELARYLLNPPSFAICKDRPAVCQKNAMFLIDRGIPASEDLKSVDFSWRNNRTKMSNMTLRNKRYVLQHTYFVHANCKDFKCRIYSLCKSDGTPYQYILLCYRFEESEHAVSPCKKARMQPSTLKAIKKKLKSGKAHEMSTWKLDRRPVAFQLVKFLLDRVRSIRFKKLRNDPFTTKAVPTLQDPVKKTNFIP